MRRIAAASFVFVSSLAAVPVRAEDGPRLRPSIGVGLARLVPSKDGQDTTRNQVDIELEASVEWGPVFLGGTWLRAGSEYPDFSFLGAKVGLVLGAWPASPFVSFAIGSLSQDALFPFDEGTIESASGLGYEVQAGAVLFRRSGLGRAWLYGIILVPTFDVPGPVQPQRAHFNVFGFGLRLAL